MTHEERILGKRLKALINSGETGHVTVRVEKGRIVGVDQGIDPAQSPMRADPMEPIETPGTPPLTTREGDDTY
jgi:hypothetical protein